MNYERNWRKFLRYSYIFVRCFENPAPGCCVQLIPSVCDFLHSVFVTQPDTILYWLVSLYCIVGCGLYCMCVYVYRWRAAPRSWWFIHEVQHHDGAAVFPWGSCASATQGQWIVPWLHDVVSGAFSLSQDQRMV